MIVCWYGLLGISEGALVYEVMVRIGPELFQEDSIDMLTGFCMAVLGLLSFTVRTGLYVFLDLISWYLDLI